MTRISRPAILTLTVPALVVLCGCGASKTDAPSNARAPGKPLAADALKALYGTAHREDGVVLQGAHEGAHWTKWSNPDGTMKLSAAHGLFTDTGRFAIEGNRLCSTWEHIDGGKTSCVHLVKMGPDAYVTFGDDGEGSSFHVNAQSAAGDQNASVP